MNNIWLATDWHLWNNEYNDGRHQFKSITRLGQLSDAYTQVIDKHDLFIHLGDLCDPSNTKPEELKAIITNIPGTKILCRGNHDTETDTYYINAGFDYVCDILKIHDIIFSHIPVNVNDDQINIHGHLHTRKLSTLDHRYINAYNANYFDKPILLEDLLQYAVVQPTSEWIDSKLDHVQEKMEEYTNIENERKNKVLDFSDEFDLEEQMIQENITYNKMLKNNSTLTGINVHELMNENSMAPVLHSLSATEIEYDDPLDEVIFEDPEDTIYWEQDDDNPDLYKEKEPMAETVTLIDKKINTPRELSSWMKKNIKYDHDNNTWRFRSPNEVLEQKQGDCHDQSGFEVLYLNKLGYKTGRLFMIEYTGDEINNAGTTHTTVWYIDHNKYYWFENAWDTQAGIHGPYKNLNELKENIYKKWPWSGNYDRLYMSNCSGVKYGMDLEEYVTKCCPNDFKPKTFYNKNKSTNENTLSIYEEVTLTAEHLAELHKAHPELSTLLPDDGKDINDPDKYYCTKVWLKENTVVASASVRYPHANSACYSDIQEISITEGYEYLKESITNKVLTELCDSRLYESAMLSTNDPIDIYDRKYEILEEATKNSNILQPVYIFLVNSGSALAKMIGGVTGDDYTHAAISFTPDLKTMYSFGKKQENGKGFGFAVESINNAWYKGKDMLYSIYCIFVNQSQLKKMKDRVQYFVDHGTNFLFDFPGLVLNAMNISANPQHRWFCSRFVADVLNSGSTNKKNQYIKDASYMRPNDFTQTNFAHFICSGKIKDFKKSVVITKTNKALQIEENERLLQEKKQKNYIVSRFQETAELHPMTREEMNKLNAKYDLQPIGKDMEKDKEIEEYDKKHKEDKEYRAKVREVKRTRRSIERKAIKDSRKKIRDEKRLAKMKNKNEEIETDYLFGPQERFFTKPDFHNTVLGENFKLELEDKNFRFIGSLVESSKQSNKLVPVYIILTHSYSTVSTMVKVATGDKYTHASISFDSSLNNMYTFGRRSDASLGGSFKIEDVSSEYYQDHDPPIPYGLFVVFVTESQKALMEKKIRYFARNKNNFHFDFFGLFVNAMGISNNPKNRYFCSRFVGEILNAGSPEDPYIDDPSLQKPNDYASEKFVKYVCSGKNIATYEQDVADRIVKDLLRSEMLLRAKKKLVKNENYNTFYSLNSDNPYQSDILHYKLAMLEDVEYEAFLQYLDSFKIQYDTNGNIIVSRKELDYLWNIYRQCRKQCDVYYTEGNIDGIKIELCKIQYVINMITTYYLNYNVMKSNRMKKDFKEELYDLKADYLKLLEDYLKIVTISDPTFNFNEYYNASYYMNRECKPKQIISQVGTVLKINI